MKKRSLCYNIIGLLFTIICITSCSTTKRLGEDELLYTGVKKMHITSENGEKVPRDIKSAVEAPLNVPPNNSLISPYIRYPFPIGLWAYNYLKPKKEKGFKYWLYKKLSRKPVLISEVKPDLRLKIVDNTLNNYGYFGATSHYELDYGRRDHKKAKITYWINIPEPYDICSIEYMLPDTPLGELINNSRQQSIIKYGTIYNADTLAMERERITRILRNDGYYFFQPDYIEYLADTTIQPHRIALRITLKKGIPENALRPYKVGKINVNIAAATKVTSENSLKYRGLFVSYQNALEIRPAVLRKNITLRTGQPFKLDAQDQTLTNLNKLGIFRYVNTDVTPFDSIGKTDSLNFKINAGFDIPIEAGFETDVSAKTNDFVGPGASFNIKNNNVFGGGETFSIKLRGAYEWQTGRRQTSNNALVNSYEFGLNGTFAFPRLLVPNKWVRHNKYPGRTSFQLGSNLMNRPGHFRILAFGGSSFYDFQTSEHSSHNLTLFKLSYNKLLNSSQSFNETMEKNPSVALSFKDMFIPVIGYTYTFDRVLGKNQRSHIFWQTSITEAGNIISGFLSIANPRKVKKLFGNEYSQFVKGTTDIKFYHRLWNDNWLATRVLVGIGQAYGNSSVMPFSEQFYIGGANSIRAFTSRSLGPGSYHPAKGDENGYFDQTGNFKFEANIEFRFKIYRRLHGAVFLDAGNIWLLENDPRRPGGKLKGKTFFEDLALGTGTGLRYDLGYLILRADLGIGIHTPYHNPHKKGYYNISDFNDAYGFHLAIGYPF